MAQQTSNTSTVNKQCTMFVDLIPFRSGRDLKIMVDASDDSEDDQYKNVQEQKDAKIEKSKDNIEKSNDESKDDQYKNVQEKSKDNIRKYKDIIAMHSQQPASIDHCLMYPCKICGKLFHKQNIVACAIQS